MSDPRARMLAAFDELAGRRVVLVGGKGGVGKTTVAAIAALHYAGSRRTILFTTDPASNLGDLLAGASDHLRGLTVESLDAHALYERFLADNLESFLEIGDRGTYLDREELRSFFELSLPGVDELMAWMRIGELAEKNPEALVVVDTAPTGHALRMLASAGHFREFGLALDAMAEKHREMVQQLTRRDARDAVDEFIETFRERARSRRALLTDRARTAFVPVLLSEPWVVEQTLRLIREVGFDGIDVPFAVLNRAIVHSDCMLDERRGKRDRNAREALSRVNVPVIDMPRSCEPLDSVEALRGKPHREPPAAAVVTRGTIRLARMTFLAGKGGVGKTTASASIALQLARANPEGKYVVVSVDPAHSLRDVFAHESPPANLTVETIETGKLWRDFREKLGRQIERAVDSLTPGGMKLAYDAEAMQQLVEIAPPGADELFAINRLADLAADATVAGVVVDTAPTGHFLRLLDLPASAGEWVREFMRMLLRYRELVPAGSLGEELVRASRALRELGETLRSEGAAVIVVTRPERLVVAETIRLLDEIERRGIASGGVIANYVAPANDCRCDAAMRAWENAALASLGRPVLVVERRDDPVTALGDIERLVPIGG